MAIRAAPEGLPMVAFTTDAASLDLAAFVARHGNAFLVQLSGASQTTSPGASSSSRAYSFCVKDTFIA